MTDEHRPPPAHRGEGRFEEKPIDPSPAGGPPSGTADQRDRVEGAADPGAGGGAWPRDYHLAWTLGGEQPGPVGGSGRPAGRGSGGRRRRRRPNAAAFAVLASLVAVALGVTAVVMSRSGEPSETVRYIQVRPPEIVGPAPEPGAAPAPPPPVTVETPQPPATPPTEPPIERSPEPGGAPPPPAPVAESPQPAPPVAEPQEPVVAAAGQVQPSVVLLQTSQGQGSGIIYDTGGLVLTAAHVVEGAQPLDALFGAVEEEAPEGPRGEDLYVDPSDGLDALEIPDPNADPGDGGTPDVVVHLASGVRTGGRVLAANRELDVAVVQIDPSLDLTAARIGGLSTVEVGQTAVAVGSPFGMENVVTVGVVSAVNQILGDEDMPPLGMIQTDAPINFGNSGGALADLQGRVIGMNVAIQSSLGGGNIGVGFATPIEVAVWIAEELRAGREVRFGFLGISGYTPPLGEPGAIVASVTPGGPAEAAGMEVEDRIISFDGQPVASMDELAVAVRLRTPGTEVVVEVVRDDLLIRLFVPLGDRGESLDLPLDPSDGGPEPETDP